MAESAESSVSEGGHTFLEDELLGITILKLSGTDDAPLYHVHQKNGVPICDNFLLGCCYLQEKCPYHHTPFPYHWQWRRQKDKVWLSFSFSAQHHLEKLYCNQEVPTAQLRDRRDNVYFLNFNTMALSPIMLYDQVRRLSNSSNPDCSPYLFTEWKVYYNESCHWLEYDEPIAQELVAAFERGMWNHAFRVQDQIYNVDLKQFIQRNVKMGFTRDITFRPVWRSADITVRCLRSLAPPLTTLALAGEDPLDLFCGPYPAACVPPPQGGSSFTMAEVTLSEVAHQMVRKLFHAKLPEDQALVLAIYRIRNDQLWDMYMSQKRLMFQVRSKKEHPSVERHLFHGTAASRIKSICIGNFNPDLAGSVHGAVFGRGVYFARDASYSNTYALAAKNNVRHMFLAKVLTGRWWRGHSCLRQTPPILTPAQIVSVTHTFLSSSEAASATPIS
uniref:Protein mono-ADP-ribosyltransferase TIPARP-like n=1 Tax=Podarcis muralis TaxID=64176 RepID=A0A670HSP4_PODMU|nr:protein mono-ADP-ribosyltransferase TIPARP-like [Podarcis muralis]